MLSAARTISRSLPTRSCSRNVSSLVKKVNSKCPHTNRQYDLFLFLFCKMSVKCPGTSHANVASMLTVLAWGRLKLRDCQKVTCFLCCNATSLGGLITVKSREAILKKVDCFTKVNPYISNGQRIDVTSSWPLLRVPRSMDLKDIEVGLRVLKQKYELLGWCGILTFTEVFLHPFITWRTLTPHHMRTTVLGAEPQF